VLGFHKRAGRLSAFYVEGDLSFSLPAMLTGLSTPMIGLTAAAEIYGTVVILPRCLNGDRHAVSR
jgi:hypothetical protein